MIKFILRARTIKYIYLTLILLPKYLFLCKIRFVEIKINIFNSKNI